jgi:hypothetical protein
MLTFIDPATPPKGCTMLILSHLSIIHTKLYAPGANPDVNPAYSVSATEDGKHVDLRRNGDVIARIDFTGKKMVHTGGGEIAIAAWAVFEKEGEAKVRMPTGTEYMWRELEGGKSEVSNKTSYAKHF